MGKRKRIQKREKTAPAQQLRPERASPFPWRPLYGLLISLAVVALCTLLAGAPRKKLIERQSSPQFVRQLISLINRQAPQVVFVGSSMLIEGVSDELFTELTGVKTMNLAFHGAASAVWYLTLKNVLLPAWHKPDVVVIFFRDQFLTDPGFRVTGIEKRIRLDPLTTEDEPLLDRLAYFNELNSVEYFMLRNWRLYQERETIKTSTETAIKNGMGSFLGAAIEGAVDEATSRTFANKKMNKDLLTIRQLMAEQVDHVSKGDFSARVEDSFLPRMIELAEEGNFKLVFVRIKMLRDAQNAVNPASVQERYVAELRAYLEERRIPLIDFTSDERLKLEHYGEGDHLSQDVGRPFFTRLLSEELKPYLPSDGN
jgi:hypothetical protein